MNPEDFAAGLDRYGSNFSRWPAELRVEAEALLQSGSGLAWRSYKSVGSIDTVLAHPAPYNHRALLERILVVAMETPERFSLPEIFCIWQRRLMAGAVMASLAAGLIVGWSGAFAAGDDMSGIDDDVPGLTWSPGEPGDWQ